MRAVTRTLRLSVGTLLHAQDRTEALIAKVVSDEAARAAAEVSKKRERRAAVIAALLLASERLATAATAGIVRGRTLARDAATDRLVAELDDLGIDAASLRRSASRPLVAAARRERAHEDTLHAESAGSALAGQWRAVAVASALGAMNRDRDPVDAVAKTPALMRARVLRTATTESTVAYNSEHAEAIADAVRYDGDLADKFAELEVMREWSAMIDACEKCWPLDGERVEVGETFSGGNEPGHVHAHCRCIEILVSEAASLRKAA